VYSRVYEDAQFRRSLRVEDLVRTLDPSWYLVLVGDAWMHPGELAMTSSSLWDMQAGPSGLRCLARLADAFPHAAWLNPEGISMWDAPTIREIAAVFAMFPLTLAGLGEMAKVIRKPPALARRRRIGAILGAAA
jgi:uncharacterized protein with von Willebrand factor type A (vWA) domain